MMTLDNIRDASGRSFDTPAAPHTWIARSTTRSNAAGTKTLIAEMSVRESPPLSITSAV